MKHSSSSIAKLFTVLLVSIAVAACGTNKKRGAYYQDDGPGKRRVDINSIPNAVPRDEPILPATLKPYKVNGKQYVPLQSAVGFLEEGRASWYGKKYHGRKTATGEVYDMYKMTAAHPTLPLPSYVRVTNVANQRSVIVRVNDRGPFIGNRIIDLSYVAARKLGVASAGTGNVIVESISPNRVVQPSRDATTTNPVSQSKSALPTGEIPAQPAQPGSQYRYNLPASTPSSVAGAAPLPAPTPQRPQLVPQSGNPVGSQAGGQARTTPQPLPAPRYSAAQWIQVGAFSVRKNAQQLLSRLQTSGYNNAQISQRDGLFKVLVGPLTEQQLSATQGTLRSNGYSAIVAKP